MTNETFFNKSITDVLRGAGLKGPTAVNILVADEKVPAEIWQGTKDGERYYVARCEKVGIAAQGRTQNEAKELLTADVNRAFLDMLLANEGMKSAESDAGVYPATLTSTPPKS